jgi:hypothetical protein
VVHRRVNVKARSKSAVDAGGRSNAARGVPGGVEVRTPPPQTKDNPTPDPLKEARALVERTFKRPDYLACGPARQTGQKPNPDIIEIDPAEWRDADDKNFSNLAQALSEVQLSGSQNLAGYISVLQTLLVKLKVGTDASEARSWEKAVRALDSTAKLEVAKRFQNESWFTSPEAKHLIVSDGTPYSSEHDVERVFSGMTAVEKLISKGPALHDYALTSLWVDSSKMFQMGTKPDDVVRAARLAMQFTTASPSHFGSVCESVMRYTRNHGLTERVAQRFTEHIIPRICNQETTVEPLRRRTNIWGLHPGDWGLGDAICQTFIAPTCPAQLHDLTQIYRMLPGTNLARLEQNRADSLGLSGIFRSLRDFVHDERPGVHAVISAMIQFYETGSRTELERLIANARDNTGMGYLDATLLNRSSYETEVSINPDPRVPFGQKTSVVKEVLPAIDVLRRLEINTRPVQEKPPTLNDQRLQSAISKLDAASTKGATIADVGECLQTVNPALLDLYERGECFTPELVLAISWLDRRAQQALKVSSFEDELGICKNANFIELLRYQELIGSAGYDPAEFQTFVDSLKSKSEVDARKAVCKRTYERVMALNERTKPIPGVDSGTLWSFNATHELLQFSILKPAQTAVGKRLREEMEATFAVSLWGNS